MRSVLLLVGLSAFALASQAAAPRGNPEQGKQKSAACAACHGADGNSQSGEFPKLAGQHADYLFFALSQYKAKQRKNPIMAGFVATLSRADMADLAAYYASQKGLEYKY